ncbi:cullin-5, partial [Striga asiatica]
MRLYQCHRELSANVRNPSRVCGFYYDLIYSPEGCFGKIYERKRKSFLSISIRTNVKLFVVVICLNFGVFFVDIQLQYLSVIVSLDYLIDIYYIDGEVMIALKYDGLKNSPGQLRYNNLCTTFALVVDLAADDEVRARLIVEWIQFQAQELSILKTPCSIGVGDPKLTKKRGAPRKVQKSPSELTSNKKKKKNEAPLTNKGNGFAKELIKQTNELK